MDTKFLVDFDTKRYIAYDHDLQKQYIDYFFSLDLNLGSYETLPDGEFTEDDNLFAHLAFKENLWPLYHDINNRLINLLPLQAKATQFVFLSKGKNRRGCPCACGFHVA